MENGINGNPSEYPGSDSVQDFLIWRTCGIHYSREVLGCGFLHKKGPEDIVEKRFTHYGLVYVIRGEGVYIDSKGNEYELKAGSLFQRFPDVLHSTYVKPESKWTECFITLGSELYNSLRVMGFIHENKPVLFIENGIKLEEDFYRFMFELDRCPEGDMINALIRILTILRNSFLLAESNSAEVIENACSFFKKHCAERRILSEYCDRIGWSYEKFRKFFKKQMGISPSKFIIRQRLDQACRMLRFSDDAVYQIADKLGYSNPYEFSSQFKVVHGLSPREFRTGK